MCHLKKYLFCVALGLGLVGCTAPWNWEEHDAIAKYEKENKVLREQVAEASRKLALGELTPDTFKGIVTTHLETMDKNIREITDLKTAQSAKTAAALGGAAGIFGRSALHLVSKMPLGGPWGLFVSQILGLLLGGSETAKKKKGDDKPKEGA